MLNVDNQNSSGAKCTTGWDSIRTALAAKAGSLFDLPFYGGVIGDQTRVKVVVCDDTGKWIVSDYSSCNRNDIAWALDPWTSCQDPGCTDPWSGPGVVWTFQQKQGASSHVPACDASFSFCVGSPGVTAVGLAYALGEILAEQSINQDPTVDFFNLLITDGKTNPNAIEVSTAFDNMATMAQAKTFVLGINTGLLDEPQIADMALEGGGDSCIANDLSQINDCMLDFVSWVIAESPHTRRAANDTWNHKPLKHGDQTMIGRMTRDWVSRSGSS